MTLSQTPGPIGVFDSGFGGLTVLEELTRSLPDADFVYLGDNARAPYGSRSFELVYRFTLEAQMDVRHIKSIFQELRRYFLKIYLESIRM